MASDKHYQYDIAISYAGEDRDTAFALAESLRSQGVSVFYDRYEKATLWGKTSTTTYPTCTRTKLIIV